MKSRQLVAGLACIAMAGVLLGCPLAGPLIVGPYKINFDVNCDDSVDQIGALFLYGNGIAEVLIEGEVHSGTWAVDGSVFTMTIPDFGGDTDGNFEGEVGTNGLTDGTYSYGDGPDEGCWTGDPVAF